MAISLGIYFQTNPNQLLISCYLHLICQAATECEGEGEAAKRPHGCCKEAVCCRYTWKEGWCTWAAWRWIAPLMSWGRRSKQNACLVRWFLVETKSHFVTNDSNSTSQNDLQRSPEKCSHFCPSLKKMKAQVAAQTVAALATFQWKIMPVCCAALHGWIAAIGKASDDSWQPWH